MTKFIAKFGSRTRFRISGAVWNFWHVRVNYVWLSWRSLQSPVLGARCTSLLLTRALKIAISRSWWLKRRKYDFIVLRESPTDRRKLLHRVRWIIRIWMTSPFTLPAEKKAANLSPRICTLFSFSLTHQYSGEITEQNGTLSWDLAINDAIKTSRQRP